MNRDATVVPSRHIESTLLKATATAAQIDELCDEAAALSMLGVCVMPGWVRRAERRLSGTPVLVVSVAGFPLGSTTTAVKVAEAASVIDLGAREVDMVLNVGALLSGEEQRAKDDIAAVALACHSRGARLKVILELGYLSPEQKAIACSLAVEAGADFVKTSTGFGAGGATVADVALLRAWAPATVGVKAAGGIRDLDSAMAMLKAGADRIGTSAGREIALAATRTGGRG